MYNFLTANWAIIITILFLISELLAGIPSVKANSVFGFLRDLLKGEVRKVSPEVQNRLSKDL